MTPLNSPRLVLAPTPVHPQQSRILTPPTTPNLNMAALAQALIRDHKRPLDAESSDLTLQTAKRFKRVDENSNSYFLPTESMLKALDPSKTPFPTSNILPAFGNPQAIATTRTSEEKLRQLQLIEKKLEEYKKDCPGEPKAVQAAIERIRLFYNNNYQEFLDLSDLKLSSLPDIFDQPIIVDRLIYLNVSKNKLKALPHSIYTLVNLTELDLSNNQLSKLDESINNLKNLSTLILNNNFLKELPEQICFLSKLLNLLIENNNLTKLPENIGNLKNLELLDLFSLNSEHKNRIQTLPPSFTELLNLTELSLENTGLTELPHDIGKLTRLRTLQLSDNKLTTLPNGLFNLVNLEILGLTSNNLTELPRMFRNFWQLQALFIGNRDLSRNYLEMREGNRFTNFPDWLQNLTALIKLDMQGSLFCPLPNSQVLPKSLQSLNISFCQHSPDKIKKYPTFLLNLPNLLTLSIRNNEFERIPPSIGKLIKIEKIDLSNSDPSSKGLLKKLANEIRNLPQLKEIKVSIKDRISVPPFFDHNKIILC